MKKALIIYRVDISDPANYGINEKMKGQAYGLMANGYEVELCYMADSSLKRNNEVIFPYRSDSIGMAAFKLRVFYDKIIESLKDESFDLVNGLWYALKSFPSSAPTHTSKDIKTILLTIHGSPLPSQELN